MPQSSFAQAFYDSQKERRKGRRAVCDRAGQGTLSGSRAAGGGVCGLDPPKMARGGRKQKLRRLAKAQKKGSSQGRGQKQLKKDPGVPNVAAFKERAQREIEKRKQRMLEQKERQKAAREEGLLKRRSLEGLQQDAQKRQREFEQMETELEDLQTNLNLENENSRKSYYREFKKGTANVERGSSSAPDSYTVHGYVQCPCPRNKTASLRELIALPQEIHEHIKCTRRSHSRLGVRKPWD
ncbi:guanine nucleotide-binding protein-like 3 [Carcharodon carcharias]|uniref:guanine nucleotide-binding protein-like 3 n=1 Tax=Carcharodon carcharias TaxID=13397 RepID=UPI001B7E4CF9|nr:guanine nucleotide-binding protein-like 3 [Carcharodon carcharias]